jgi:hypothetical protein
MALEAGNARLNHLARVKEHQMPHEEPAAPKTREEAFAAMLVDWDDTAFVNLTGVGRAYSICARELRAALAMPA